MPPYNDFPLKVFYVPTKFGDINSTEERIKFIHDLLELSPFPIRLKNKLDEQDLHNLFIIASYLRGKLENNEMKSTGVIKLSDFVKKQFNERIKAENKAAIIKADAKRYLESMLAQPCHKTGFLTTLVNKIANVITGEDYIQMYEYYHKFNMQEMSKAILLKKFSSLSDTDQALFLSVLFAQPSHIVKKVIAAQSLDDLDKLRKHSIPSYQEKLAALSKLIDEYESNIRQSSPAERAEQYLNANKHLLMEIAGTSDASYENCKIDSRQNSYVIRLIKQNDTKTVENVHERIILRYAIESLKEEKLGELKDSLFSK